MGKKKKMVFDLTVKRNGENQMLFEDGILRAIHNILPGSEIGFKGSANVQVCIEHENAAFVRAEFANMPEVLRADWVE
jgi:hypothetical protein